MFDPQEQPWSNSPNAPKITHEVYLREKNWFAGSLIGSMLYGILIVLFFKCMTALFSPVYRRGEGVKWGLVSFTVVMFSLVTVHTAMDLDLLSISFIDNRDFPGVKGVLYPGPAGYREVVYFKAINIIPNVTFPLNNWLADGLLLHRCYVFYSMNRWVMAFPLLMYLGSVATGILTIFYTIVEERGLSNAQSTLPYLVISLSLNIILTLMIVVRLFLLDRTVRTTTGPPGGISGMYKTISTMLVESSALFAVSSLLVIATLAAGNLVAKTFYAILAQTQVIAPLLIVQRVASKSTLTATATISGNLDLLEAGGRGESMGGGYALPSSGPMGSVDWRETNPPSEPGIRAKTTIGPHRDRV